MSQRVNVPGDKHLGSYFSLIELLFTVRYLAYIMKTIAEQIISFNSTLSFRGKLPKGIRLLNPFADNPAIMDITGQFYRKFYNDSKPRRMILGINPGRHGAGVTGIPFSDTKRLAEFCGINITEFRSHEPSSVFVYDVVNAYGGPKKFYQKFYINSICPLGFTLIGDKGREKNYNYYDSKELYEAVRPFIVKSIKQQLGFGFISDVCYIMGTGTNYKYMCMLNDKEKFFERVVPLEHPRFIVQYRLKKKDIYIKKYLDSLKEK
jgi:hypothetical protein